jgi:integrase
MRLMECLQLRVKDVDFGRNEITVRSGNGREHRHTVLPKLLVAAAPRNRGLRVNRGQAAIRPSAWQLVKAMDRASYRLGNCACNAWSAGWQSAADSRAGISSPLDITGDNVA